MIRHMPDVLLINPLLVYPQKNIWGKISSPGIPLGLLYLAAYLRRDGFDLTVIDAHRENLAASRLEPRLPGRSPDLVGVTSYTPGGPAQAYEIARICKQKYPRARIVAGGPHVSAVPEEALATGVIDCVVRGEGEQTLLELAGGGEPSGILGISYLQDGTVVHNVDCPPQKDLDRLPFPAYDLLDPGKYGVTLGRARRFPAASIIMSRGCPYSCHFCQAGLQGKSFRSRSAENVLEEIELLQKRYGIDEFAFQDDVLTSNRKNLMGLCELLRQRGPGIEWSCLSRVDTVDDEMLRSMKAAGCRQIGFGVESGNDAILRSIGKNTTVSQARQAVRLAQAAGLEVVTYFILGLPGETEETLEETFRLSRELKPDYALYNILTPLPGTEIYNRAREEGRLTTSDWERYTASEAIMEVPGLGGDYIQNFYRKAYLRFYLDPGFLLRKLKKIRSVSDLLNGGRSFLKLLRL
jgi:radical SAM superfamily enzyme YgiQ (UPF0313 family)